MLGILIYMSSTVQVTRKPIWIFYNSHWNLFDHIFICSLGKHAIVYYHLLRGNCYTAFPSGQIVGNKKYHEITKAREL